MPHIVPDEMSLRVAVEEYRPSEITVYLEPALREYYLCPAWAEICYRSLRL